MAGYTFQQLEDLWVQAGGPPGNKEIAAAVAMAESSGRPDAVGTNTNGSADRGLWQINNQAYPGVTDACAYDPICNAKSAISISNAGSNWRPWCTAWSDNACGTKGGSYLGQGSAAIGALLAAGGKFVPNPGGAPGGTPISPPSSDPKQCLLSLPVVGCVLHRSQAQALGGGLLMVAGGAVMLLGAALLVRQSGSANRIATTVVQLVPGGSRAATAAGGSSIRSGEAPESAANRHRHQGYVRQDRLRRREQTREEARQGVIRRRESARQERFEDAADAGARNGDRGGA